MKLSIVTTLYYSEPYLQDFYRRCGEAASAISPDYEMIFVNDGSPDHSLPVILDIQRSDPRVCVIDLSRNFGHHRAMMTGLKHATGDLVFLIDSDLEEPPEILQTFYDTLCASDADVAYGVHASRHDSRVNRLTSRIFYTLFNWLSDYPIPHNLLTVRLMRRPYVQELVKYEEQEFVISVLWEMTGFRQISIPIEKKYKGNSSYNFTRKLTYVLRAVTATSNKPLIYIAYLGLLMTIPSGLYIFYLLTRYFFFGFGVDGWTSLIISVWFVGGLNIFILGIISIYLAVIFSETKKRPYSNIRAIYKK